MKVEFYPVSEILKWRFFKGRKAGRWQGRENKDKRGRGRPSESA